MMIRVIAMMLRSGWSITQIVAHLSYHTTLTTIQVSELLVDLTMNQFISIVLWCSKCYNELVEYKF